MTEHTTPFDAEVERLSREFNGYLLRIRNLRQSDNLIEQTQSLHAICYLRTHLMRGVRQIASGSEARAQYATENPEKCGVAGLCPEHVAKLEAELFGL